MTVGSPLELRRLISSHPLLQDVEPACLDELLSKSVRRSFDVGQAILREGEIGKAFWILCSGGVRVFYTSAEGLEVTVKLFSAPAVFGELELLHPIACMQTCAVIDDADCLALPRTAFLRLLERYPRFAKNLLIDMSARFIISAHHERALAFLTVPQRLAKLLLSYVRLYGSHEQHGVVLRISLSQTNLANELGVARKSVVRAFKDLTEAGILARQGPYFCVKDVDALISLAPPGILGLEWRTGTGIASND